MKAILRFLTLTLIYCCCSRQVSAWITANETTDLYESHLNGTLLPSYEEMFKALSILRELFFPQWIRQLKENHTVDEPEPLPQPTGITQGTTNTSSTHATQSTAAIPTTASTIFTSLTDSFLSTISPSSESSIAAEISRTSAGFESSDDMVFTTADAVAKLIQNITFLPGVTFPVGSFSLPSQNYSAYPNSTVDAAGVDLQRNFWALILLLFPLLTIFGNTLVILSVFRERSLQTATNYFIVSLACADLLVAAVVMPFAVYIEVNNNQWSLGDAMCDTWVATDVIASTSSIFNLTAISIDRYIAVTKPLKYARHKNHRRVVVTICFVWAVSCTIGLPMILGLNNSGTSGVQDANLCMFYNSDFIIYSSLCSFFIPCALMIYLYWRIFGAIRQRAKKAKSSRGQAAVANHNSFVSNSRPPSSSTPPIPLTECRQPSPIPIVDPTGKTSRAHASSSFLVNGGGDEGIEDIDVDSGSPPCGVDILSPTGSEPKRRESLGVDNCVVDVDEILMSPDAESQEIISSKKKTATFLNVSSGASKAYLPNGAALPGKTNHVGGKKVKPKDRRRSMKSREKQLAHRERKATKTLAIVLGVFLACWMPFFTANMINAILDKLNLPLPGPTVFMVTTWLGYGNSFMNPVIYTVFNEEFRKAFLNILSCKKKYI